MNKSRDDFRAQNHHGIVLAFLPLVYSLAGKYQGNGAEFDDLVQEGSAELYNLIPRCRKLDWMPIFLKTRLSRYMARQAASMRRSKALLSLETLEGTAEEPFMETDLQGLESESTFLRAFTNSECDMIHAVQMGYTQREIAHHLDVDPSTVCRRLRKIGAEGVSSRGRGACNRLNARRIYT